MKTELIPPPPGKHTPAPNTVFLVAINGNSILTVMQASNLGSHPGLLFHWPFFENIYRNSSASHHLH